MTETLINIERLCNAIESAIGRKIQKPKDFDFLANCIFEKLHQQISPTTLKRLWGYLHEGVSPRISTLNILSQFVDYDDWEDFCRRQDAAAGDPTPARGSPHPLPSTSGGERAVVANSAVRGEEEFSIRHEAGKFRLWRWAAAAVAVLLIMGAIAFGLFQKQDTSADSYVLKQGQTFPTYRHYLKLFGITDTTTYWGRVLPHHPNIVIWGPEYHHCRWHNEGNRDSLMPTITEWWEPAGADSSMVIMRNRDKYHHEKRLNEVRITFMKNLTDTGYVFLGVYRLSLDQSDTTHCVWERVADKCNLNNLDYLEELRN